MRRARGSITRRKTRPGLWLRWRAPDGTPRLRKARSDDPREAEIELAELLASIDRAADSRPTVAAFVAHSFAPLHASEVADSTARRTARALRPFIDMFGTKRIADVTTADAREFVAARRAAGVSDGGLLREVSAIRPLFSLAVAKGLIASNPFAGGRYGLRLRVPPPRRPELMTERQIDAMLAAAPWPYRAALTLAVDCGLRPVAIFDLTWDRVTKDAILRSVQSNAKRSVPPIPLTRRAAAALRFMRTASGGGTRVMGTLTQNALRLWWQRWRSRNGLSGVRVYDLRHQFASRLQADRVPERTVADLLGHSTTALVRSTYGTSTPSDAAERAIRQLEERRQRRGRPNRGGRR